MVETVKGKTWAEYRRIWRAENSERDRATRRRYGEKLKRQVMTHYSGGVLGCARCGIDNIIILTIDHINGQGSDHRKALGLRSGVGFYIWLRKNNYPEGYQVLCWNCNILKHFTEDIR